MRKSASGVALVLHGVGKRYRLGRSGGLVPVPLFGNRLDRLERDRRRDVEDDDELMEDEDEELDELEERRTTGPTRELWALRDVNLVVHPGEAVGVVGPTGSGKSTLMKVLGRITPPTEGRIEVHGRVAPMLGSLSGFVVPEASVRANVGILARFVGVPHAVAARNLESILRFAELEDLAHMKVNHLSRGMSDRLAYAVGLHFEPDVLLADDRVVAGDPPFQERCLARIEELLAQRTALVFASNRLGTVTDLCTHGLWLEGGQVRAHGRVAGVVDAYRDSLRPPEPPPAEQGSAPANVNVPAGSEPEPASMTIENGRVREVGDASAVLSEYRASIERRKCQPTPVSPASPVGRTTAVAAGLPKLPAAKRSFNKLAALIVARVTDRQGRATAMVGEDEPFDLELQLEIGGYPVNILALIGFESERSALQAAVIGPNFVAYDRAGRYTVTARVSPGTLPAGVYTVRANVVAAEGDDIRGAFGRDDVVRVEVLAGEVGPPTLERVEETTVELDDGTLWEIRPATWTVRYDGA
jgi:ABC-type polysaccharide/polyol phosphate transport system ATPase subunit